MKLVYSVIAFLCVSSESYALAQDLKPEISDLPKWRFSLATGLTNADIRVIESEVEVPEGFILEDLDVQTTDELEISASSFVGVIGYRILPVLEVVGRAGFIQSEVNTVFQVSGNLDGPLGVFSGPIDFETDTGREIDGYTFGLGVAGGFPIATFRSRGVALAGSYQANWNSLDEGDVLSVATRTSLALVFPADRQSRGDVTYSLGGSYNWLERDVEQSVMVNGTELGLALTQEFVEPWSVDGGVRIPLNNHASIGLGASYALSGAASALLTITFQPDWK